MSARRDDSHPEGPHPEGPLPEGPHPEGDSPGVEPRSPFELEPLPDELRRGLALGFLAMVPLLVAYELALGTSGDGARSTAELALFRVLTVLGPGADPARRLLLAAAAGAALVACLRRHPALVPATLRVVAEGAVGAVVLGPVLLGWMHLAGDWVPPPHLAGHPATTPEPTRAAFVLGAAAHEELLFRVGAYSALYLLARRLAEFFGATTRGSRIAAELAGLLGSALLFAAAHLVRFSAWLGPGGEPFDLSVFTWRLFAGILLGLCFRWRGPGVAAWTHGLFNLALLLGAGPHVFL